MANSPQAVPANTAGHALETAPPKAGLGWECYGPLPVIGRVMPSRRPGQERMTAYTPPGEAVTPAPGTRAGADSTPLTGAGRRGQDDYRRMAELGGRQA